MAWLGVEDNYANPRVLMNYSLLGRNFNNVPDSQMVVSATAIGTFNHRVIINNGTGYCRDTLIQPFSTRVSGPTSRFILPANNCLNDAMPVSNLSSAGSPSDSIVNWSWDFGNSTTSNLAFPPPVDYLASGNYRVRLSVIDNKGCEDSSFQTARIRRLPLLRITPPSQRICLGQEIALSALHKSLLTWSPASLVGCDTCATILVKPTVPTTYTAVAKDTFGCSRTQEVRLDIWYPFDLQPNIIRDTSICIGASVPFDLQVQGRFVVWNPSTGLSDPGITNPIATPLTTTTYTATVTDTGQCFIRTATATVRVNPYPQVDMGQDLILAYNTPFTLSPIYGPDITRFQWVPSIGLSCTNCPTPSGRALASTNYSLIATTSQGCSEAFDLKITIACDEKNIVMPTGFTPNGDGLNDIFYPITRGMKTIKRFVVYNRYGQTIHEKRNFVPNEKFFGWDGTFNGKLQPLGSYVYIVEAECDLGSSATKKGTISLLH
jgi:gliding motility-associated-like protein